MKAHPKSQLLSLLFTIAAFLVAAPVSHSQTPPTGKDSSVSHPAVPNPREKEGLQSRLVGQWRGEGTVKGAIGTASDQRAGTGSAVPGRRVLTLTFDGQKLEVFGKDGKKLPPEPSVKIEEVLLPSDDKYLGFSSSEEIRSPYEIVDGSTFRFLTKNGSWVNCTMIASDIVVKGRYNIRLRKVE